MRRKRAPEPPPREQPWELRLGRWQDVIAQTLVDVEICDPPYGARTHEFVVQRADETSEVGLRPEYAAWTPNDVATYVAMRSPFVRGWMVSLTSHDLVPAWETAHEKAGRYCFAPIPCVMRGMSVRMLGDGPSSWTVFAMVARPRTKDFMHWGTLDGAYSGPPSREAGGGRGKPLWLMSALVRDYSRPGDLVCDPFAGHGTTLAAALANGRRAIGAEVDPEAYAEAMRRLARPMQTDLFGGMTA